MKRLFLPIVSLLIAGCSAPVRINVPLSDKEKGFVGEWEYVQSNLYYGKDVHTRVVLIIRADRSARVFRRDLGETRWQEVTTRHSQWYYDKKRPILWITGRRDQPQGKGGYNAWWRNDILWVDDMNEVDRMRPRTSVIPGYD